MSEDATKNGVRLPTPLAQAVMGELLRLVGPNPGRDRERPHFPDRQATEIRNASEDLARTAVEILQSLGGREDIKRSMKWTLRLDGDAVYVEER